MAVYATEQMFDLFTVSDDTAPRQPSSRTCLHSAVAHGYEWQTTEIVIRQCAAVLCRQTYKQLSSAAADTARRRVCQFWTNMAVFGYFGHCTDEHPTGQCCQT